MARENLVILHGQILSKPRVYLTDSGEIAKGTVSMLVIRRPIGSSGWSNNIYYDCPILLSRNEGIIRVMQTLSVNDMVDVKGVLSTREVRKSSQCPHCNEKNIADGILTYITPLFIKKCDTVANQTEAYKVLKERSEISNMVNVIGYVCKEPDYYEDAEGKSYAQYPLAVNRRYHIKEDADDKRTDYPWVKTYGLQALKDSEALHVGSSVYINGALQSREIKRVTQCEHCGNEYEWQDNVTEIVPYYIGYLSGCTPIVEEDTSEQESGDEQ